MLQIYKLLTIFFYPFLIIFTFIRKFFNKEDNERYKEKLFPNHFAIDKNKEKKLFWFHAASLGEAKSIIPLIKKIETSYENIEILITTITLSSGKLMRQKFDSHKNIKHRYLPLDINFLIKKFLNGWQPSLALFVDSEIWPNFLTLIKKKKIPLVLLNGRITQKTFKRWSLIPKFAEKIFKKFDLCLVSNRESKEYLEHFNVKNIKFLGNLKLTDSYISGRSKEFKKEIMSKDKFWCTKIYLCSLSLF